MALVRQRQAGYAGMILTAEEDLRIKSQKVTYLDGNIIDVIKQMKETCLDWESGVAHKEEVAIAMAAMQIGQPYKIVIVRNNPKDRTSDFDVYINPKIIKYEGDTVNLPEGCLSLPGIYAMVPRPSKIRVRASNLEGKQIRFKCDGLLARVLQHEVDHFNGKLFTDYVTRQDWRRLDELLQNETTSP